MRLGDMGLLEIKMGRLINVDNSRVTTLNARLLNGPHGFPKHHAFLAVLANVILFNFLLKENYKNSHD